MRYSKAIGVLVAVGVVVCAGVGEGAWFMPLPQLPESSQAGDALAISADGSTVVGTSHDGSVFHAVRWTMGPEIGIEKLNAGDFSFARGVSDDGSIVVGYDAGPGSPTAFRWNEPLGAVNIGDLSGGENSSGAFGISSDGLVVVGSSSSSAGGEAFRWTNETGMVGIGDLDGGIVGARAYGTNSDGSVIVGSASSNNGTEAFRWTAQNGMVGLGDLPNFGFFSEAYSVSADGTVVVGASARGAFPFSYRAFRWAVETGMVALPDLAAVGRFERAEGVSGDGNVIVGTTNDGIFGEATVWDSTHGTRSISGILTSQGAELVGWRLQVARSLSYDGLTIAGLGINPDFKQQPWAARLDPGTFVPEPSSIGLGAVALLTSLAWWRSAGIVG